MEKIDIIVLFKPDMTMLGIEAKPKSTFHWLFNGRDLVAIHNGFEIGINWPYKSCKEQVIARLTKNSKSVFVAEFNDQAQVIKEHDIYTGEAGGRP